MQLNILTFSLTSKRLTYLILFSGLWFTNYFVFSQNTEWFITLIYPTFYFFLYKLTSFKGAHSTLLFIVVIAVRWSHRQAHRGCIRSFILSLWAGNNWKKQASWIHKHSKGIKNMKSSPRAGKLPPIRHWQTDKKTKLRCIQLKEIVIKINRIFLYTLNHSTLTPGVEGHRRRLLGE